MSDRNTHDRTDSHIGIDTDVVLVLSQTIDIYDAGSDLHEVLVDLDARISALEDGL